ncbi:MAG: phosphate signaling complex protein PhoU [Solirubrobacterales bacterium]
MTEHTVKSYDDELNQLSGMVRRMGALAEAQLAHALDSLARGDADLAARVIAGDAAIDTLEFEVQHVTVRLLALRQPMASDLRLIVSALKMASSLERIGDYAANIAKRSLILAGMPPVPVLPAVLQVGSLVADLLKSVLDAFAALDVDLAVAAWSRDAEVDDQYTALVQQLVATMTSDARTITACTHLLFIAKNIERIGDHATNIAESLHFLVKGRPLTERRPKGHEGVGDGA